ncbi:MAG TPA: sensor histidine kinase, partial [Pseudomonadota bacterium]|nr:sensor histidine kinase [Pseudomonadota bacterium]
EVQRLVNDVDNKILAMALVHQKLYESRNLSRIDLGDYLRDLAAALVSGYSLIPGQVKINTQAEAMVCLIDLAVPCGLVVTELVSNAFKHAFPRGQRGEIQITLSRIAASRVALRVADNGIGPPVEFDPRRTPMLGLRTVFMIVEHQLKGTLSWSVPGAGMVWDIEFPDTQYSERV